LDARLDETARYPITFVLAAPGSGKTSMVAGWPGLVARERLLWQSARHGDPVYALAREILAGLDEPDGRDPRPLLVVTDDCEVIDERQALQIEELVAALPRRSRLIFIGRHPGALSVARLGLRAEVAVMGDEELRFTPEEATALVQRDGRIGLDTEAVRSLLDCTWGWGVGLRLAGILLSETSDVEAVIRHLSDVGGPIAEYLDQDVLAGVPTGDRAILQAASLTGSVTADFCAAVSGRDDALSVLERLVAHRVLLYREGDGGYRLHPLMAGHLRNELAMQGFSEANLCHLRAAEWFGLRGHQAAAMRHYIAGDRVDLALEVGVRYAVDELAAGRIGRSEPLLPGDIPESYFAADPARMYALAASLLCASRIDEAATWLRRMEVGLPPGPAASADRARAHCLWAVYDLENLVPQGALDHFEQAGEEMASGGLANDFLSSPKWLPELDNAVLGVLPWIVAQAHADLGHPDRAARLIESHGGPDRRPHGAFASVCLAAVALAAGRFGEAVSHARRALDAGGGPSSPLVEVVGNRVLSRACFVHDDLEGSIRYAHEALRCASAWGCRPWVTALRCDLASLSLAQGNVRHALSELQSVRSDEAFARLPAAVTLQQAHSEFRCWLALGDLDRAMQVVESMPVSPRRAIDEAHLLLCTGRPDKAARAVERGNGAELAVGEAVEKLLLEARIDLQIGDRASANHALIRAVERARPERIIRPFVDEPEQIGQALLELGERSEDAWVNELAVHCGPEVHTGWVSTPIQVVEPLTDRERELLGFLPSHHTQGEIAQQMYISINTVKTHMKGLYRKLGVTSRSSAVDSARAFGLL
jgi:LuxR family maltose regulon positive regulatory protein